MMLSLDEAIQHCNEVAEELEQKVELYKKVKADEGKINNCSECAADHKQLADWLRELKELRKNRIGRVGGGCANCIHMKNEDYTKRPCGVCCNNYFSKFEEVNADENTNSV